MKWLKWPGLFLLGHSGTFTLHDYLSMRHGRMITLLEWIRRPFTMQNAYKDKVNRLVN